MKIFELHYSTAPAGAERVVVDLSNELSKNNEVTLCIIKDDSDPYYSYYLKDVTPKIKYINLKCKKGLELKALWRIFKTIKKEKPDVVHTHGDAITLFLPSLLLTKIKYFHTLHSVADKYIKGKEKLIPLYRWFYKHKIKPITISEECQNSYRRLYNLNNSIKIENGRSQLRKTDKYLTVKEEIDKLKSHADDKVFIHIARCCEAKNQELLINAFNLFLKEDNHGILIIIGNGFDEEKNKHIIENAEEGIYWLGTRNNVCDYLLNSNFFLLSSLWEGLPISLLEAMSCGVIPICTPAGGIPNVIMNRRIGFLSKDFEVNSFYEAIKEGYNSYNEFDKSYLQDYFNINYSINKSARLYIEAFLEKL
ncbi:glycosyltransferase [Bacteroides sp. ET336]|uniref:glycosyltransferase n=1 Tax=Bacteroides sp. ET336 TaxID=2972459 RepID=UPI0021ACF798|nr:glycosyltransferase [Bacteroides sp. ET336]MCR8894192.1 glycosyltransferase [Bacteroides sp. ET336]MDN0058689.1 glycosyltransferase [Bacteroides caecigallinarum]